MELTYDERKNILCKPYLDVKDIMRLEDVKLKTGQAIMNKCRIAFGGRVIANSRKVTTDSYLQYAGQEKGTWIRLISAYEGGEKNA